jgi:formylglycine-generating enzyme required for sulfatase activity
MARGTRAGLLTIVIAALAASGPGCAAQPAAETPGAQLKQPNAAKLPKGWTAETRKVKAATPKGEQEKEITYYKNSIGMEMGLIRAGEFMMGGDESPEQVALKCGVQSDEDLFQAEQPQHRVRITRPFYMGKYLVTQSQWRTVMGKNPSYFKGEENPVETVSWTDAVEFCKKLSAKEGVTYRLPTEAEWEYACRAGTTTPFYFGGTLSTEEANYDGDYTYGNGREGKDRQETTPVGSFAPNAFGLYDMHGNLLEWCQDRFEPDYYWNSPTQDPTGPATGKLRAARGGSMETGPVFCRSAFRVGAPESLKVAHVGFRVVCDGAAR